MAVGQLQLPYQRATAGQPVRLAPRPPVLAGREKLLAELDARLWAADGGSSPRTVALCGLGGVGKTSVAVEYAYRHLGHVGVAWQFAAEDATVLAAGFGELAAQLGHRDLADTRDPVASVHAVLARFPESWLLIFDNAADLASVAAFLPPAGPGRVLITSQNPNWPGQPLGVPVLDLGIAAGFLTSRTGDPDRQAALDLADMLGGLPLALEQAAAYLQAAGGTLAGYLALFRQRRAEMLARGEPAGYDKRVTTTWALAFAELDQDGPAAVGLLRFAACCAAENIPLYLLLRPRPGLAAAFDTEVAPLLVPLLDDVLARDDAVAGLRRYSLISAPHDGMVSVHRLVQAITIALLPTDVAAAWRQATATVIESALPDDPEDPAAWPAFAALLPHAQAALTVDSCGLDKIARYLDSMKRPEVVAALRELPERQREAIVLRYYGDLSEAEIASVMDISRGAVKSHDARGLAALRAALKQEWRLTEALLAAPAITVDGAPRRDPGAGEPPDIPEPGCR